MQVKIPNIPDTVPEIKKVREREKQGVELVMYGPLGVHVLSLTACVCPGLAFFFDTHMCSSPIVCTLQLMDGLFKAVSMCMAARTGVYLMYLCCNAV